MPVNSVREHILDGTPDDVVQRYESLGQKAQEMDFGPLDRNLVVVDTETTGLSFNHDELIQIAAARVEEGAVVDWYITFVDPGKPIPEDIQHLTGITQEDIANAPAVEEALEGLVTFAGDATMVAHNANFDKTFLTKHPAGYPLLQNTWLDSLDLSRIALPRLKSHRLIDLVHTFGAPVSTHRADDDVAATCVVFRILLAGVASMPLPLVREIGSMAPENEWATGYAFRMMAALMEGGEGGDGGASVFTSRFAAGVESPGTAFAEGGRPDPAADAGAAPADANPGEALAAEPGMQRAEENGTLPFPESSRPAKPLFSLAALRRQRISRLPALPPRKDADDLAGSLIFPTAEQIDAAFSASGLLGRIYPAYEMREEQRTMAQSIRSTFEASENLVVEAGTGVGKSMAYLVAAALFALQNNVAVGVATKTNGLLDQLVYQELPALADALAQEDPQLPPLTWAPLKGMGHYPCLRKVARIVDAGPQMREVAGTLTSQAPALAALLSFIEQSDFSDMDSLKIDFRALPRYSITSTSNDCLKRKCPFFGRQCFAHGARRRAEGASIVVTNHSLLLCDVAADGALLPTIRHWVVDEAHSVEDEARNAFALEVSSEALERLVRSVGAGAGGRSVYARAERAAGAQESDQLTQFFALVAKAKQAAGIFEETVQRYLPAVKELLFFEGATHARRGQVYDPLDLWINAEVRGSQRFADLAAEALALVEAADGLIKRNQDLVAFLEGIDEAAVAQREIASLTLELRDIRNAAEVIFGTPSDLYVYQAKLSHRKDRYNDSVQALLLDVGEPMNERFYARTHSVVFASATLSVGESFDPFQQAVGLGAGEFSPVRSLQLDSSYDFDNRMLVYVVSDMPEPNDSGYLDALNRLLVAVHRANRGSVLTLFTNRREMEKSYGEVAPALKGDDLRVVCQKWGVSVKGLRDDFLADKHLSLFALKSFWEGFDAPGDTLRGVVIPKLPFARPTDPLYCERASRDDRAWWRYVLPQAVIETKQAAGRLIRKADDRGVLILADKRLVTKGYGKTFLNSLQSRTVRVATIDEIAAALEAMEL